MNTAINIREELEEFEWTRAKWSETQLMAASPFRYDNHPSFYVYLTDTPTAKAGSWGDRGATDSEYERGGFVKLLAFLRQETTEETLEYLTLKYGLANGNANGYNTPKLNVPTLRQRLRNRQSLDESVLSPFRYRHPYLLNRGVDERVQRLMGVGYSKSSNAVTLPWRLANGQLANVKFRKTAGKAFWYVKGGVAIRDLIYGIDILYRRKPAVAVITEAEIDALTVMSCGFAAVGTGGSAFNRNKADLLIRAPVDEYVIATDNDAAGRKLREEITKAIRGYKRLSYVELSGVKDVNELRVKYGSEAVKNVIDRRIAVNNTLNGVLRR